MPETSPYQPYEQQPATHDIAGGFTVPSAGVWGVRPPEAVHPAPNQALPPMWPTSVGVPSAIDHGPEAFMFPQRPDDGYDEPTAAPTITYPQLPVYRPYDPGHEYAHTHPQADIRPQPTYETEVGGPNHDDHLREYDAQTGFDGAPPPVDYPATGVPRRPDDDTGYDYSINAH